MEIDLMTLLMENGRYSNLKTQSDAVIYFLQQLDISMIDSILDEAHTYQDLDKSVFIQKLDITLNQFLQAGDSFLNKFTGFCNSEQCSFGCNGYRFVGNKSGNYLDLIIQINKSKVLDIYECISLKSLVPEDILRQQIFIDDFNKPF